MLSAHGRISITPETHFVAHWAWNCRMMKIDRPEAFLRFWTSYSRTTHFASLGIDSDEIYSRIMRSCGPDLSGAFAFLIENHAKKAGKPRGGEKTPNHYKYIDTLLQWYPDARIVYLLRDPRAVVASRLRMPWGHKDTARLAREWQWSVSDYSSRQNDARQSMVQYERLVQHPQVVLHEVCNFLEEQYDTQMLLGYREAALPLIGKQLWKDDVRRELNTEANRKWRSQLGQHEISIIEHFTRSGMSLIGYKPEAQHSLPARELARLNLRRIARRIWMLAIARRG